MVTPNDFKSGMLVKYNGEVYEVMTYSRSRTAQRRARVLARIRNVKTGSIVEESFESEVKLDEIEIERHKGQFMYGDDSGYHFMDTASYDQITLPKEALGDKALFLTDGLEIDIGYIEGQPLIVDPPMFVVLEVVETEPNYRGDTATGGGKAAKLATGLTITVPFFVKTGDHVKVDTRTNNYVERA